MCEQWVEIAGQKKIISMDDFVIARSAERADFVVESFSPSGPLLDDDTSVLSKRQVRSVQWLVYIRDYKVPVHLRDWS